MTATEQAGPRRPAPTRESASRDVDELAWPPSSDDLDAIDVVPMAAYAHELKTHRSSMTPIGSSSLPDLPDLLAVHDLAETDTDTFRSEATQSLAAADLPQSAERGRSWTRLALYAAASVVVLMTVSPFEWTPAVSPDLPRVAEFTPTVPIVAPLAAPVQDPRAAETAVTPVENVAVTPGNALGTPVENHQIDIAEPAPSAPRVPDVPPAHAQPVVRPESQRVLEPESQRVLQPDAQPERPAETMARTAVPLVAPSGALPPLEMAPMPAAASLDVADAPPAAPVTPTRTAPVPDRTDEVRVQAALQRFESAYSRLDARAAQAVWPSVDARALARAFESLESQSLQFHRCELDVRETVASADCLGTATYVRRIGSKAPRTEPRGWTFNLQKTGDAWHILSASAR